MPIQRGCKKSRWLSDKGSATKCWLSHILSPMFTTSIFGSCWRFPFMVVALMICMSSLGVFCNSNETRPTVQNSNEWPISGNRQNTNNDLNHIISRENVNTKNIIHIKRKSAKASLMFLVRGDSRICWVTPTKSTYVYSFVGHEWSLDPLQTPLQVAPELTSKIFCAVTNALAWVYVSYSLLGGADATEVATFTYCLRTTTLPQN